jgi:CRISPR-associated endonuclease/helicase Cas3
VSGFLDYWGKARADGPGPAFHRLAFHCLDVAAVGAELLARDGRWLRRIAALSGFSSESLRETVPYLLALHDLGKFAEAFQYLEPSLVERLQGGGRTPRAWHQRHDTIGYVLWWRSWASARPAPGEADVLQRLHPLLLPTGRAEQRDIGDVLQSWMAAALGHHGKPPDDAVLPPEVFRAGARSRTDALAFALAVKALLAPGELISELDDVEELITRAKRSSWWVAGFAILCDWLGSDTRYFRYVDDARPLDAYWSTAREAARVAVDASGLCGSQPRHFGGLAELFPRIAQAPTPLQSATAEIDLGEGPQLFVLEDLTGSGKTEAALVLAQRLMGAGRADGLFFALPTMATANAMHGRVSPLLERLFEGRPSYLLTHSGPRVGLGEIDRLVTAPGAVGERLTDQPTASATSRNWLADGRKKALLAELGVGTIDQALLAVLQSKHAALRLLGLHRHVLLVDEVHACDAYMLEILSALLRAHAALGGSAILLSATLPLEQRAKLTRAFGEGLGTGKVAPPRALDDYPLITACGGGRAEPLVELPVSPRAGSGRSLPVRWHDDVDAVVLRLVDAARAGRCACWIRNSVKDAVEAYERVASEVGRESVTLFHARFALGDRLRIERDVLNRFGTEGSAEGRRGRIVIATQVVEQSLDIDFDVMVTDLCPIDLLIQRAGRLQRHAARWPERPLPELEILSPPWSDDPPAGWLGPPFHRTARVYDNPGVLWRTARELQRLGQLALPRDARALVEAVYAGEEVPPSLERRSDAALGQDLAHAAVGRNATVNLDIGYLRTGADWSSEAKTPTRLGEPTVTLRLAQVAERGARAWIADDAGRPDWQLSQLSVALRLVARPTAEDELTRRALEATQPFLADDVVTVLLRRDGEVWTGRAIAERRRGDEVQDVSVRLVYSDRYGLDVREGS